MSEESLEELKGAFELWRSRKKHAREVMPEPLLTRARRAGARFGVAEVARAVGVDRRRLEGTKLAVGRTPAKPGPPPAYSRVEVSGAGTGLWRPFAELELPGGIKVRLYSNAPEAMSLLSSVCGAGGGR